MLYLWGFHAPREPMLFFACYFGMVLGRYGDIENEIVVLLYNIVLCGILFGVGLWLTGEIRYFKELLKK